MSAKALVVLADGFEDVEAVTAIDVLRRGGVEVVTAALAGGPEVRSAHGVTMLADAPFSEAEKDDFDAIILPGGGEGTDNLKASAALAERLPEDYQIVLVGTDEAAERQIPEGILSLGRTQDQRQLAEIYTAAEKRKYGYYRGKHVRSFPQ